MMTKQLIEKVLEGSGLVVVCGSVPAFFWTEWDKPWKPQDRKPMEQDLKLGPPDYTVELHDWSRNSISSNGWGKK